MRATAGAFDPYRMHDCRLAALTILVCEFLTRSQKIGGPLSNWRKPGCTTADLRRLIYPTMRFSALLKQRTQVDGSYKCTCCVSSY